ncbi:hypothetical protein RB195_003171 [Necator americanus]|uniref:Uncharacterized protein n=2 Tax=Necator americanus TaxID=51031 RepID=A0ABR1DMB0_NECAM|nr:hypothetical protein NECAME_05322 [Necator americanus]ETN69217.1 hypothetical protein NECAME_05322 [Necator americanus]
MDFFDVRKLTSGQPKDLVAAGDDYSAVAFLPVVMIGAVVLGICGVCQYKKWKHEKKQIAHLNDFYEILEETKCHDHHGKMVVLQQNGSNEVCLEFERIRRAMLVPPPDSSPFFQPSHRTRSIRYDIPQKATTATEVIFHFTNLNAQSRKISIEDLSDSEIEYIV